MDSILELESTEIKQIKKLFKQEEGMQETFHQYASQLFETGFLMILSSGAKAENFRLLKEMETLEDDQLQIKLNLLLEIVLNICASVIKVNVKGIEEFAHVLSDLGIDRKVQQEVCEIFQQHYLDRVQAINNAYEDQTEEEENGINPKVAKKFPANLSVSDEALSVSNPRLVDIEWKVVHTLSSKNLNKMFQPRFQITLTMLTQQGGSMQQGAGSLIQWSSKRNYLKLKKIEFECDQTELTHLIFNVKSATNSLEQMTKSKN